MSYTSDEQMNSVFDRFTMVQGFKSSSASRTDIWEAVDQETGQSCIFKAFVYSFYVTNNETQQESKQIAKSAELLQHEIDVYKALRETLIVDPAINCRNILWILGEVVFEADDLHRFLEKSRKMTSDLIQCNMYRNLLFLLRLKERPRYSITDKECKYTKITLKMLQIPIRNYTIRLDLPVVYKAFITPKIDQRSLSRTLERGEISDMNTLMRYLFVILITTQLMSTAGVNQNDLHWSNILLSASSAGPSPLHKFKYFLVYNDRLILIDNPYIPILFDFDRSAVKNVEVASLRNDSVYAQGGCCPDFNPKRDFVKTLCCIWHYSRLIPNTSQYRRDIMTELITEPEIRKGIRQAHEACWLTTLYEGQYTSLMCIEKYVNKGVASRKQILDWVFKYCNYQSCTLKQLKSVAKLGTKSPHYPLLRIIANTFTSDLNSRKTQNEEQLRAVVRANIQVVETTNAKQTRVALLDEITDQWLEILTKKIQTESNLSA